MSDGHREGDGEEGHAARSRAFALLSWEDSRKAKSEQSKHIQLYKTSDFAVIQTISDDQFIKIAEHIRLQKVVSSFAVVVMTRKAPSEPQSELPSGATRSQASYEDSSNFTRRLWSASNRVSSLAAPASDANFNPRPNLGGFNASSRPRRPNASSGNSSWDAPPQGQNPWAAPPTSTSSNTYFGGGYPRGGYSPFMDYGTSVPPPMHPYEYGSPPPKFPDDTNSLPTAKRPDPEIEKIKAQLELLEGVKKNKEEAIRQKEHEDNIRRDAVEAFQKRSQEMKMAQEEAKKEVEKARASAEHAARKEFEALREAEATARAKLEAEMAMRKKKGIRRFMPGSK